jgi:hypothetical protein
VLVNQPLVPSDAVLAVYDVIAGRQATKVLEERARRIPGTRSLSPAMNACAEYLFLGDEHQAFCREHDAPRERADDDLYSVSALIEPRRIERIEPSD